MSFSFSFLPSKSARSRLTKFGKAAESLHLTGRGKGAQQHGLKMMFKTATIRRRKGSVALCVRSFSHLVCRDFTLSES